MAALRLKTYLLKIHSAYVGKVPPVVVSFSLITTQHDNCRFINDCIYKLTTWWWICNFQIGDMIAMYL